MYRFGGMLDSQNGMVLLSCHPTRSIKRADVSDGLGPSSNSCLPCIMSHLSPLHNSLQKAIAHREVALGMRYVDKPIPSHGPDLFSNNYLSLSSDHSRRDVFLRKVQEAAPTRLFGSTGSRVMTGNSSEMNALETAFKQFFAAPSALLFSSGFNANVSFFSNVPQNHDVIIYDELVHASCIDGIRLSSCPSYSFTHNSVAAFEKCVLSVQQKHPHITRGTSTVFIVLESLYSMDGDLCPLTEIVELAETHLPAGCAHIVVDEAHTTGLCGPNGTGYVSHLGLNDRVHTQVHVLSKAWGFHGGMCCPSPEYHSSRNLTLIMFTGVLLTSQIIKDYLINFSKSIMFSTEIPFTDIYALEATLSVISSARGQEV